MPLVPLDGAQSTDRSLMHIVKKRYTRRLAFVLMLLMCLRIALLIFHHSAMNLQQPLAELLDSGEAFVATSAALCKNYCLGHGTNWDPAGKSTIASAFGPLI